MVIGKFINIIFYYYNAFRRFQTPKRRQHDEWTSEPRPSEGVRLRPLTVNGQTIHQVGMPWHWGYQGIATGDVANNVTSFVADPNVSIHEGKAFTCRIEKGRRV